MSSIKLKLDNWVKRSPDRAARHTSGRPLTEKQKKKLAEQCMTKCISAYKSRMIKSALLADYESQDELAGEAIVAMWNILNKFDLSKCGPISRYDVPGQKNPKTLAFYFYTYFCGRVNFIACEARQHKKLRGIGPVDSIQDISYDAQDMNNISESNHDYEITGVIFNELEKKDLEFKRFFIQKFKLQQNQKELREEYGEKFNFLMNDINKFIFEISRKNKIDYDGAGK